MARFDNSFDATGIEPAAGYDVLPAGKYVAQIIESEMRVTSNGMGQFLWLMLDILDGPLQGRKAYDQLNLINPNPTTVEMAQRTLSAICHATGQLHVSDSEDLHFKPMTIRVSIRKPKDGGQERNQIRYLVPKDEPAPVPPRPAAPQRPVRPAVGTTPTAPSRTTAAPWKAKA